MGLALRSSWFLVCAKAGMIIPAFVVCAVVSRAKVYEDSGIEAGFSTSLRFGRNDNIFSFALVEVATLWFALNGG